MDLDTFWSFWIRSGTPPQPGGRQKENTEDHSPYANVKYSNLCILCHDCLDLPRRLKTSKVKRKLSKGQKRPGNIVTAATVY